MIGSGPAGVACARALLDAGRRVRMLDAGLTLEPDRVGLVEKLKHSRPEEWTPADLAAYQAGMNPDVGGVPLKLVYGSDFAYREADEHLGVHYDNVGLRPSLAKGGLSNVWGAAMMPFLDGDLDEWPFKLSTLAPHYAAVLELTGLAACHDDLETLFPLYTDKLHRTASQPAEPATPGENGAQPRGPGPGRHPLWPITVGGARKPPVSARRLCLLPAVHVRLPLRLHLQFGGYGGADARQPQLQLPARSHHRPGPRIRSGGRGAGLRARNAAAIGLAGQPGLSRRRRDCHHPHPASFPGGL